MRAAAHDGSCGGGMFARKGNLLSSTPVTCARHHLPLPRRITTGDCPCPWRRRAASVHGTCLATALSAMSSRAPAKVPVPSLDAPSELHARFAELEAKAGARSLAVSISDLETDGRFAYHADRWFHAASTIKVAILLGVYGAFHRGDLLPQSRVHVRNRFLSAYDGTPYRVSVDRDANSVVHREIGRTLRVSELAEHMI